MSTPPTWGGPQQGQGSFGGPRQGQGSFGGPQPGGQGSFGGPQPGGQGGYGGPQPGGQGGYGGPPTQQLPSGYGAPPQQSGGFGAPPRPGSFGQPQSPYAQPTPTAGMPAQAFGGLHGGGPTPPAKKKPGAGLWIGIGAGALVLLLVLGAVIGEFVTRGNVSGQLEQKAQAITLESGDEGVVGTFEPKVDGFSYLTQAMGGTYEHISFTGVDLTAQGQPLEMSFDAYNVPADLKGAAERIETRTHLPVESVVATFADTFQVEPGDETTVELTDGSIKVTFSFGGAELGFSSEYAFSTQDGKLMSEVKASSMTIAGETIELGSQDPVEVPICGDLGDVTPEMTEATITPDGVDFAWNVSGAGATLDNLTAIGNCLQGTGAE